MEPILLHLPILLGKDIAEVMESGESSKLVTVLLLRMNRILSGQGNYQFRVKLTLEMLKCLRDRKTAR